MSRHALFLLLVGLLTAGPLLRLPAAPPSAGEVERLIRQLGSPSVTEREAADRRLDAIGEPALGALGMAADTSTDAEIRRRSTALLKRINRQEPELIRL